jgi:hypothetical protein
MMSTISKDSVFFHLVYCDSFFGPVNVIVQEDPSNMFPKKSLNGE